MTTPLSVRLGAMALLAATACGPRQSATAAAAAPSSPPRAPASSNDDEEDDEAGTELAGPPSGLDESPSQPSSTPSRPPPLRSLDEGERYRVLMLGEWSFAPDVDRWASYNRPVSCAAIDANKFGGVKIERKTSSGRRRTPLEFRDVLGTGDGFQRLVDQTAAYLEHKAPDIVVVMMGQIDEPLVVDGVELAAKSEDWRAEYERRMRTVLEVLAPSRRHVVWVELPTVWPSNEPARWADHRAVQAAVLGDPTLRVDRRAVEPFSATNTEKRTSAELAGWLARQALEPICQAVRG